MWSKPQRLHPALTDYMELLGIYIIAIREHNEQSKFYVIFYKLTIAQCFYSNNHSDYLFIKIKLFKRIRNVILLWNLEAGPCTHTIKHYTDCLRPFASASLVTLCVFDFVFDVVIQFRSSR